MKEQELRKLIREGLSRSLNEDDGPTPYGTESEYDAQQKYNKEQEGLAGEADSFDGLMDLVNNLPDTISYINVQNKLSLFQPGSIKVDVKNNPNWKEEVREIITNTLQGEGGDSVNQFKLKSFYGPGRPTDPYYIQLQSDKSREFGEYMAKGGGGSLDEDEDTEVQRRTLIQRKSEQRPFEQPIKNPETRIASLSEESLSEGIMDGIKKWAVKVSQSIISKYGGEDITSEVEEDLSSQLPSNPTLEEIKIAATQSFQKFKNAAAKMSDSGQMSRANKMVSHGLKDFIGKTLDTFVNGKITDIVTTGPGNYKIIIEKSRIKKNEEEGDRHTDKIGEPYVHETKIVNYDEGEDWFAEDTGNVLVSVTSRKDAVLFSKLANIINPNSKITPQGFEIEEYQYNMNEQFNKMIDKAFGDLFKG